MNSTAVNSFAALQHALESRLKDPSKSGFDLVEDILSVAGSEVVESVKREWGLTLQVTSPKINPEPVRESLTVDGLAGGLVVVVIFEVQRNAFERFDVAIRVIIESQANDSNQIRALEAVLPAHNDALFKLFRSVQNNGLTLPVLGHALQQPRFGVVGVCTPDEGDMVLALVPRVRGCIAGTDMPVAIEFPGAPEGPSSATSWALRLPAGEDVSFDQLSSLLPKLEVLPLP